MKKINFKSIALYLCLAALGMFVQGCSEDMNDNFSEDKNAKIMALAEQYGLDIILSEDFVEDMSMQEIEDMFQELASIKGEYELVKSKDEDKFVLSRKKESPKRNRLRNFSESGSWSGTSMTSNHRYSVSVSIS